ncbi:MAG: MATE family efflux transporter [Blautia sp.]|nr:MATE family efflux transporter [Blautia sp.]
MSWIKKIFEPVDMIEGTPWQKIAFFAIPMLLGNIAQQLYNTVDSVVVGRYVGDNALAAVGSAAPLVNLLIVLFVGIGMGSTIMVSQYLGARQRENLSRSICSCIIITGVACLFIMIFASLASGKLLELLNTPESIIDWCHSYLLILFVGCAGSAYYNILSGVLRGLGDSISALLYLVVACVLNIVLDVFFVAKLNLGVNGVALATIIAQAVSAALCMRKLCKMTEFFEIKKEYFRNTKRYSSEIIKLGLPSGITQAIISLSMVVVQSLTNSFGEAFIAANVMVMRVDGFAMLPNFSFGTALTTYAGQNVGAGKFDRVKLGAKQGTIMAMGSSAAITALILLFGRPLMGIFTETPELIEIGMTLLKILAVGYVAMAISQSLQGIMRGAGDTMTPMWLSLLTSVAIRVPLAYILVFASKTPELPQGRREFLYVSLLIAWLFGAFMSIVAYKKGKWKKIME